VTRIRVVPFGLLVHRTGVSIFDLNSIVEPVMRARSSSADSCCDYCAIAAEDNSPKSRDAKTWRFMVASWFIVDLQCISGRTADHPKISILGAPGTMYPANITVSPRRCTLARMAVLKRPGSLPLGNSLFFNIDIDGEP